MIGLPIEHASAQIIYDEMWQAQIDALKSGDAPAEIIHQIEVIYDHKQQIASALVELEKKLCSIRDEWERIKSEGSRVTYIC
jgi:hypothetical protein